MIKNNYHKTDTINLNSIIFMKIESNNEKQLGEISTYDNHDF